MLNCKVISTTKHTFVNKTDNAHLKRSPVTLKTMHWYPPSPSAAATHAYYLWRVPTSERTSLSSRPLMRAVSRSLFSSARAHCRRMYTTGTAMTPSSTMQPSDTPIAIPICCVLLQHQSASSQLQPLSISNCNWSISIAPLLQTEDTSQNHQCVSADQ